MKVSFVNALVALGAILIISCQKEETQRNVSIRSQYEASNSFSIRFTDIYDYIRHQRKLGQTKGEMVSIEPFIVEQDTVMYLINYQDGWELLSADKRAPKTFAMSEGGNFSFSEIDNVPPLRALFDRFAQNIAILKRNPALEVATDFTDKWDSSNMRSFNDDWELESETVIAVFDSLQNHLTTTEWGQGSPWNCRSPYTDSALSSHCLTGCVPVAIAQILYYIHQKTGYPTHAYGESSTTQYIPEGTSYIILQPEDVSFDITTFLSSTWSNMSLYSSDSGSFASVSTLMTQIGLYIGAMYYSNSTYAYVSPIGSALSSYYSINSISSSNIDFHIIADQIIVNQMPVFLLISRNGGAHGVVADACKEHYQTVSRVFKRLKAIPCGSLEFPYEYKYETTTEMTSRHLGINWGWNGSYMTSGGETIWFNTDVISWDVGYVYTSVDYMIYGFSPNNS